MFRHLVAAMAMLSGRALAHAKKAVYAFSPVSPYEIHLTAACRNPIIQRVSTVQRGGTASPLAVPPAGLPGLR
ncbi:hypothetical protein [Polaromonas sp. AER18D-145]|uniref:hypothetical protein n=1 Tax=Polaromonas sp. AER18D-145 TaxID=1977060 RepID=UPI0011440EE5|nr:hypothetical protein [Polaromonas sp. AER18D-145]